MAQTQFSVLLPVYEKDEPEIFAGAIKSVVENIKPPTEILILQDGPVSQKLEAEILRWTAYKEIILHKFDSHVGLTAVLNFGLSKAKCEIILRADADDINKQNRFGEIIDLIDEGYDLVGGDIEEVDIHGVNLGFRRCPQFNDQILSMFPWRNPFNHMTVGFKKSVALSVGGYPQIPFNEDYGLWAKMAANGHLFRNTGSVVVRALVNDAFVSRRSGIRYAISEIKLQRFLLKLKLTSLPKAILVGSIRATIRLFPKHLIKVFYSTFLRKAL